MSFPDNLKDIGIVRIATTAPTIGLDGDLWWNPNTGALSTSNNGAWQTIVGGGQAEVHVGSTVPLGQEVIWIDTSDPAKTVAKYLVGGVWQPSLDGGRY